jgi:hypothetical protein
MWCLRKLNLVGCQRRPLSVTGYARATSPRKRGEVKPGPGSFNLAPFMGRGGPKGRRGVFLNTGNDEITASGVDTGFELWLAGMTKVRG